MRHVERSLNPIGSSGSSGGVAIPTLIGSIPTLISALPILIRGGLNGGIHFRTMRFPVLQRSGQTPRILFISPSLGPSPATMPVPGEHDGEPISAVARK